MLLSKNFNLREITSGLWQDFSPIQQYMITHIMSSIMQPIRDCLGCSVFITSGVRSIKDYNRLKASGFFPSETSDHFYGAPVPVSRPDKIAKYGHVYTCSVGAIDFVVKGLPMKDVFDKIRTMVQSGKIQVGQLIHEYGNSKEWIHVSNPPSVVYSQYVCETLLKKPMYMVSVDMGKTYQEVA